MAQMIEVKVLVPLADGGLKRISLIHEEAGKVDQRFRELFGDGVETSAEIVNRRTKE